MMNLTAVHMKVGGHQCDCIHARTLSFSPAYIYIYTFCTNCSCVCVCVVKDGRVFKARYYESRDLSQ